MKNFCFVSGKDFYTTELVLKAYFIGKVIFLFKLSSLFKSLGSLYVLSNKLKYLLFNKKSSCTILSLTRAPPHCNVLGVLDLLWRLLIYQALGLYAHAI